MTTSKRRIQPKEQTQFFYSPLTFSKFKSQSSPEELRTRLRFGRPDLTILDVRDRKSFNREHISGAIPAPLNQLPGLVRSILEPDRDIYLYGKSDQETTLAANKLRSAGFNRVSELVGGLPAWKAVDGSTEGYTDW